MKYKHLCHSYAKIAKYVNLKLTMPFIHPITVFPKADNSCFYLRSYTLKPTNETKGVLRRKAGSLLICLLSSAL